MTTNRSFCLKNKPEKKHLKLTREILIERQSLREAHKALEIVKHGRDENYTNAAMNKFRIAKKEHRFITRSFTHKADLKKSLVPYSSHQVSQETPTPY